MAMTDILGRMNGAFSGLGGGFRGFGEEVNERGRELNVRLIEMAQENTARGFDTARAVIEAKDVSEAFKLQQEAVREGFERGIQQSREIAEMFTEATTAAFKPLREAAEDLNSSE